MSSFQTQSLIFIDQSQTDKDFSKFLQKLHRAIDLRDYKFIYNVLKLDTNLGFGKDNTVESLAIDNPNSLFWLHLEKSISIGCARSKNYFANNTFWYCPPVNFQNFKLIGVLDQVFIMGQQVEVKSKPDENSSAIGQVSNEIVEFDYEGLTQLSEQQHDNLHTLYGWMPVILNNGKRGYVNSRYAYSAVGYRSRFAKSHHKWQMVSFLAGD